MTSDSLFDLKLWDECSLEERLGRLSQAMRLVETALWRDLDAAKAPEQMAHLMELLAELASIEGQRPERPS